MRLSISKVTLHIILISLIVARLLLPHWNPDVVYNILSWDVFGYYIYLPSIFIYNDLFQLNYLENLIQHYPVIDNYYFAFQVENGNYIFKYPMGLSLFYAPFFFLGHILALLTNYAADGYSVPYQASIAFGNIFYAMAGLVFLRKFMLNYFTEIAISITLILITFGTNYLNYTAYSGAHSHNFLFGLYALILLFTHKWHETTKLKYSIGIGVAIGLAIISRPSEAVAIFIPLLWGIYNKESLQYKLQLLKEHYIHIIITGLFIFLMVIPQLIYWKAGSGNFIVYSYEDQGFSFLDPHIKNVLIGFRKGWLIYTPMMLISLIGFISLFKKYRNIFIAVFVYFILNLWVVTSWDVWWYGGGFGMRALVQSYAVLAIPFAALVESIISRKLFVKTVFGICVVLMLALNIFQTWQYHQNIILDDGMNQRYYMSIFGKTKINSDDQNYLTRYEKLENDADYEIKEFKSNDFEEYEEQITESISTSGNKSFILAPQSFSPSIISPIENIYSKNSWIRASVNVYDNNNVGSKSFLVISFEDGNEPYKWQSIILKRNGNDSLKWQNFYFENKIPQNFKPSDVLKVHVWNTSDHTIIIDDMKVQILSPK